MGRTFQAGNFSRDLFHFKVIMAAVRKTDRRLWAEGRVAAVVIQMVWTGVRPEGTEKSAWAGWAGESVRRRQVVFRRMSTDRALQGRIPASPQHLAWLPPHGPGAK